MKRAWSGVHPLFGLVKLSLQLILLSATLLGSFAQAFQENADPYNALIWNRKNALAQNGRIDRDDWYEWWYYKVVVPETDQAYYFVYGVVNPWDTRSPNPANESSRSYVGFGDFSAKVIGENKFGTEAFSAAYDRTFIQVGDNTATDQEISGAIEDTQVSAKWHLNLSRDWSFNAMGWGMFQNWVSNIYWYPAQASAAMTGWIETGKPGEPSRRIELDHAPAYQDRNWGRSFPKWWTWLVSNHFKNSPGTVLASGGGRPKIFNEVELISAVVVGLKHEGKEYSFRPNDGDKISIDINYGKWEVVAENRNDERIEISANAPKEAFLCLPFMTPQGQWFYDYETLKGNIKVKLFKKKGWFNPTWVQIADLETDEGGIEYGSPQEQSDGDASFFDRQLKLY